MILREINKYDAIEFVQEHHYSPVLPKITKHYLGLFVDDELMAVTTLGWGTQPLQTINKMFPGLTSKDYFEIGKQCVHPDMPKNSGTQLLSLIVKWIKTHHSHKLFLYTMADGIMAKTGIQYQAANFYFGEGYKTQVYMIGEEKCHPRSVRPLLEQNALELGKDKLHWLTSDFMLSNDIKKIEGLMFRYIMPLSKKAKKMMKDSTLDWRQHDYPKDKDLIWWDITAGRANKTQIDQPHFTYDDVVYNKGNINQHIASKIKVTDFV